MELLVVVVCKQKNKKMHPAWIFLRKMPEKQLILFAWPYIEISQLISLTKTKEQSNSQTKTAL